MDEKNKRSEPQIPIRKEYIGAGRSDSISNGQPNDKRTRRRPDEYMDPGMPIQNKEPEKSSAEEIIFEENNSRRAPSKTPNLSRAEADKKRSQAPQSTALDGATRISAITTKAQPNAPKRPEKKQKKE